MLFNSFVFLLAFPTIFAAYYLCPIKWRSWLLLLISYAVYMNWVPVYALILLWVTLTTYTGAHYISRNSPKNKLKMTVAGILTLLPLLFFKYYNFINGIVYDILTTLHLRIEINTMHWAAPIGISFFSFQAYGYLAERILQTDRLRTQPPGLCTVHFIFSANSFGSYQQGEGPAAANQKSQNFRCRQSDTGVETVVMGLVSKSRVSRPIRSVRRQHL